MGIHTRAFSGTPESAALLQPWMSTAHPQPVGVWLGVDLSTGEHLFIDPWLLKHNGFVNSLMTMVLGQKGRGKSTLAKVLCMRLFPLAAGNGHLSIRLNNLKPEDGKAEYKGLSDHFRSTVITLRNQQINIFDQQMLSEETDLLDVAVNVSEFSAGKSLQRYEPLALQVGMYRMLRDYDAAVSPEVLEGLLRRLDQHDVDEYYRAVDGRLQQSLGRYFSPEVLSKLGPDEHQRRHDMWNRLVKHEMARPHHIDLGMFQHDASLVSSYLGRVIHGDMGKLFGGRGSLRPLLTQPATTLDWTGLNTKSTSLMRSLMWKTQTAALVQNDLEVIPHLDIDDEDHGSWNNLVYARSKSEYHKIARAFPTMNLQLTHRIADYKSVGEEGSEQRQKATNMLRDIDIWFVGRQNDDRVTLRDIQETLGFSGPEAYALTRLQTGQFALKIGDLKPIFFQLVLVPSEIPVVKTDRATARMVDRIPMANDPDVRRRLEQAAARGIRTIGQGR